MTYAIGCDHAGYELKETVKRHLSALSMEGTDVGTHSTASVDYPDYAHPVADLVESGKVDFGILICGSGNGIAIAANKHQGIRAAICWQEELAALARQHNDANILVLPARFIENETAIKILDTFLNNSFEGGRHANRVQKIACC